MKRKYFDFYAESYRVCRHAKWWKVLMFTPIFILVLALYTVTLPFTMLNNYLAGY